MDERFLKLKPKRFLCPFCGEWHEWEGSELNNYDEYFYSAVIPCKNMPDLSRKKYEIFFKESNCDVTIISPCSCVGTHYNLIIPIADINESAKEPIVTFEIKIKTRSSVDNYFCSDCDLNKICNLCKLGAASDSRNITLQLGFEFELSDYEKISKVMQKARKEEELTQRERELNQKEQEIEIKEQQLQQKIEEQEKSAEQQKLNESKQEEQTMEKSLAAVLPIDINSIAETMGVDFGICEDPRIRSTILGTAVQYEENNYRVYNRETGVMTKYTNLNTLNMPILKIPVTSVKKGQTILHNRDPYFVDEADSNFAYASNPVRATREEILPIENPLGIKCYTRLISAGEILGFNGGNTSNEKIIFWLLTTITSKMYSEGAEAANNKMQAISSKVQEYSELLLPFACVAFAAYAIKDDKRLKNIEQVAKTAKKSLGIDMDFLKDKNTIKRIMGIAICAAPAILTLKNSVTSASNNEGDEKVESAFNKLIDTIKPSKDRIMKVLPVALVIGAIKLFNTNESEGKEWVENIRFYLESALITVQDTLCEKFNLSEEFFSKENLKKFGVLALVAGVSFAVYGKNFKKSKETTENEEGLMKQIIPKLAPAIPLIILAAPTMKGFIAKYSNDVDEDTDSEEFEDENMVIEQNEDDSEDNDDVEE